MNGDEAAAPVVEEQAEPKKTGVYSIHIRPNRELAEMFERARKSLGIRASRSSFGELLLREALAARRKKTPPTVQP